MKCQILLSGKNKKHITSLSSAGLAKRVVKVNPFIPNGLFYLNNFGQVHFLCMECLVSFKLSSCFEEMSELNANSVDRD